MEEHDSLRSWATSRAAEPQANHLSQLFLLPLLNVQQVLAYPVRIQVQRPLDPHVPLRTRVASVVGITPLASPRWEAAQRVHARPRQLQLATSGRCRFVEHQADRQAQALCRLR